MNADLERARAFCPSPENLLRFFRSESSKSAEKEIRTHLTGCHFCAAEALYIVRILSQEKELIREIATASAGLSKASAWKQRFAVVLTVIALAGAAALFLIKSHPPKNTMRGSGRAVVVLAPVGLLDPGKDAIFEWKKSPSAEYSKIELFDDGLKLIWRSGRIAEDKMAPPAKLSSILRKGGRFFWTVTEFSPDGRQRKSGLIEFRIQSESMLAGAG